MSKAIFLGSFNPPHKGHYNCIKSFIDSGFMESLGIDKIHIIPCHQNPNKKNYTVTFYDRYKMCCRMFRNLVLNGKTIIDDVEYHIEPEYTYDLLKWIHAGNDKVIGTDFWWIITAETLQEIIDGKWFCWTDILTDNKFIIMYGENDILYDAIQLVKEDKLNAISVKINNEVDYHSTQLREKIKNGESIVNETNKEVQNYIEEENLYK